MRTMEPLRRSWLLSAGLTLVLLASTSLAQAPGGPAQGTKPEKTGFAEARTGDIPEGAAELITTETQKSIEAGLAWLSKQQNADGSYGSGAYRGNIAVTSLSALAMMASGSSPGRGPYGPQIDKALQFVMDNTSPSGFISVQNAATHGPMYSHGFGALFLAEAYGMTRRPEIREKLEKAIRLIVDTQNGEGGWRYQPVRADADLSVTICQINALRAARNAGIFVPKETVEACIRYVKQSQNLDGGFRYMLSGGASAVPSQRGGRGGAVLGRGLRLEGGRSGRGVSEAVHARDQVRPALQSLFLRALLRGAGDVDSRGRGLDPVVSGHPRRIGLEADVAGLLER